MAGKDAWISGPNRLASLLRWLTAMVNGLERDVL